MFKNYFITALRNIYYNKLSSGINIGGLAIGIAVCLLIFLFVRDELSFDKWIKDLDRIYKLELTLDMPGRQPLELAFTQLPVGPALRADYPQIDKVVRIANDPVVIKRGEAVFEETVYFVDKGFFSLFDIPAVIGERELALTGNANILLSETMSQKYFGEEDPRGEILTINGEIDYQVVGVIEDTPVNSHFRADFVALLDTNRPQFKEFLDSWDRIRTHTYIKLKPGVDVKNIESDLSEFVTRNDALRQLDEGDDMAFNFISVADIHLFGTKPGHLRLNGDITTVITFSIIALFILIIASINFMNLSTARAMNRAREVSIRKVHGASRKQLMVQFLGEALIMTFIAFVLALVICVLVLPWYNEFLNKQLGLGVFFAPLHMLMIFAAIFLIGFLGGAYPAFVLSSFRPAKVLRSNKSSQQGSSLFINSLVVLQFSISIVLCLITSIVYVQTNFARNIDFGFETENKINIFDVKHQYATTLEEEFNKIPGVNGVAFAKKALPYRAGGTFENVQILGNSERTSFSTEIVDVGYGFFDLFNIEPREGRVFSEQYRGDMFISGGEEKQGQASIVVNQSFLHAAGIADPSKIIDRTLVYKGWGVEGKVVGLIDDIYTRSLYHPIEPMAFVLKPNSGLQVMTLAIAAQDTKKTLMKIDEVWRNVLPDTPLYRDSVTDRFDALYYEDDQKAKLFTVFSLFAMLVSCLGLYGLASYTIGRYSKEIGVRKVLGASVIQIVRLLVWQFTKPVLVACLISFPIATWLAMDWLLSFQYRIDLLQHWYIFLMVALMVFSISWVTVAGQSAKVARNKLVDALQSN